MAISFGHAIAQTDSTTPPTTPAGGASHLRVSLLTCGPGDEEIWEVFGHTAVRVIDSTQHLDLVYNYGTFDYGPDFELQFMRGKLLYSLSVAEFEGFMPEYVMAKRSVEEQVLLVNDDQKKALYAFLNRNAEPAHRYYKYDFFLDNCATRIRDVFPRSLGSGFVFGRALPEGARISYRDIMNSYFFRDHWTRMGVNILLGSRIDKPMSNEDIMFLPDYLRDGVRGAKLNGALIAAPPVILLPRAGMQKAGVDLPFFVTCIVALLTIAGLSMPRLRLLGRIMSTLLLAVTGLLGCIILVMWFATDHQGCANNYNLLWCIPTNIIIAFFNPRGKPKYSLIAIIMLFASLILHVTKVQGLTLFELAPLFLALIFVYGTNYRKSLLKPAKADA